MLVTGGPENCSGEGMPQRISIISRLSFTERIIRKDRRHRRQVAVKFFVT
jgi:hypothetical protein